MWQLPASKGDEMMPLDIKQEIEEALFDLLAIRKSLKAISIAELQVQGAGSKGLYRPLDGRLL